MTQQINLYHPIFRKERKRFSAVAMAQAGAVMIVGIFVIYAFLLWHVHQLRGAVAEAASRSAAAAKQFDEVNARFAASGVSEQLARLEREIAERQPIVRALQQGAMGNRAGYSSYLIAFAQQRVAGLWLTGFSIDSDKLSVQGRARNADLVPVYMARLGKEKPFNGMQLHTFLLKRPQVDAKSAATDYLEFQVGTEPAGGAR